MSTHRTIVRVAVIAAILVSLPVPDLLAAREKRVPNWSDFSYGTDVTIAEPSEPAPVPVGVVASRMHPPRRIGQFFSSLLSFLGLGDPMLRANRASFIPGAGDPRRTPRVASVAAFARRVIDASGAVSVELGCEFSIADLEENNWDFTYDVRLYDPSNDQIHSAQSWVANKPAHNARMWANFNDPPTGSYKCTVQWWVDSWEAPLQQQTRNLSYIAPSGETTAAVGWSDNYGLFEATLTGANFAGRLVAEADGGSGTDDCHYSGSPYDPFVDVTGGSWWVSSQNKYGDDYIGYGSGMITHYRAASMAPCNNTVYQLMTINRPGTTVAAYKNNVLHAGIASTTIWSQRDGVITARSW